MTPRNWEHLRKLVRAKRPFSVESSDFRAIGVCQFALWVVLAALVTGEVLLRVHVLQVGRPVVASISADVVHVLPARNPKECPGDQGVYEELSGDSVFAKEHSPVSIEFIRRQGATPLAENDSGGGDTVETFVAKHVSDFHAGSISHGS